MITDPYIDAVSICTTNDTHAEIAIEALQVKKHGLCEKLMATSLNDGELMVNSAHQNDKILMIGQNQRLTKAHRMAKNWWKLVSSKPNSSKRNIAVNTLA